MRTCFILVASFHVLSRLLVGGNEVSYTSTTRAISPVCIKDFLEGDGRAAAALAFTGARW